ncbi:MAG: hypothetical protein LPK19_14125, partial [Hymenobacteraceae bacterium]|nr:hypothetical protein [Hymenobacteraceae bacterium]MDX5397360.1 hypothetical protein [Hymenobacteraceae bacterium]MDX5513440.1 hypothetical protein [Hymenobacteraceae bacterium]
DINNGMYLVTSSATSKWVIIGGDRLTTTGTSYIDFEFLQNPLTRIIDANGNKKFHCNGPHNGRQVGDFVLSMEYSNGGTNATVHYYRWELSGATYKYVEYPIPASTEGVPYAFAKTNGSSVGVPFGAFGANSYIPFAFVEAAVNIDRILAATNPCTSLSIKTLFIKTKASDSYNAALKDFMEPQQVDFQFGSAGISYASRQHCPVGTISPTVTGTTGGTFSASPTGLSINSSTGVINLASSTPGTYVVTYSFNAGGGCTQPDTFQLTINPNPTITLGSNPAICSGTTTASLTYSAVTGSPTQYRIDFNAAANSANLADVSFTNLPSSPINITVPANIVPNTYSGILQVKNAAGCVSAEYPISVTIHQTPVLQITNPSAVCSPATVDLTAAAVTSGSTLPTGTQLTYWTNSNGTGSVTNPGAVGSGTYYIKATSNTTPACSDIKAVVATVNDTVARATLSVVNPTCEAPTATVTVLSPRGTDYEYSNNGGTGYQDDTTFTYAPEANYSITVRKKSTGCVSVAVAGTIASLPDAPPSPLIEVTAYPNCSTSTGTITVKNSQTNAAYGVGFQFSNDGTTWTSTPDFSFTAGGGYHIRVRRTSDTTCVASAMCDAETPPAINRVVSPSNPAPNVIDEKAKALTAYPIPFSDQVTIEFTSDRDEEYVINLYDMRGNLVKQLKAGYARTGERIQVEVNGRGMAESMYIARKVSQSGSSTVKLLKQNE